MFPEVEEIETESTENNKYNVISDGSEIRNTPNFDIQNKKTILENGNIQCVNDYQNVRNWISLFFRTPLGKYPIYDGTSFGTSLYLLKGYKNISGLMFAQIKSEVECGLLLNPNIKRVDKFNMYKNEKYCAVEVRVELADGYILETKDEVFNII